jgi:hypothetical protein
MLSDLDIGAISYAVASTFIYNGFIYSYVCQLCSGKSTVFTVEPQVAKIMQNSFHWARKHQNKEDAASVTLAIQTLRNTILVAIFVGGSAVNLALSFTDDFDTLTIPERIRAIILSVLCFCSFLSWVLVIRFSSQLGYLIGTLNIPHVQVDPSEISARKQKEVAKTDDIELGSDNVKNDTVAEGNKVGIIIYNSVSTTDVSDKEEINKVAKEKQLRHCTNLLKLNSIMFRLVSSFIIPSLF